MSQTDVAELAGVTVSTIKSMRSRGEGGIPDPDVLIGLDEERRAVPGWREATIKRWLDGRRKQGWR